MIRDDTPLWLFADQLGTHVSGGEHAHREVLLVESTAVLRRRRYHRQKLHLVLSALRHAADDLGDRATVLRTDTYREALERFGRPVLVHEPTSHAAADLVEALRRDGLVADVLPTPTFALSRKEFRDWAGDRTRFRMEEFYRDQRRRFELLMDGDQPVGGRWNFDAENREPPPKDRPTLGVPSPYRPREDEIDDAVRRDLDRMGLDTVGVDGPRLFPVTPAEARRALKRFVERRLPDFGRYEDAIMAGDWAMAHSMLSVPLNLGLLHPLDVLMVLGNHALRRGYQPAELTDWFATTFVDGFAWVMPTNVIGMSQHADGGLLATKPYASGGAYIDRMSDHCGDCAFDPKKRVGDDACPFTAGYWAFVHRNRELLAANNRTARAVSLMDRLSDLDAVLEQESARELF